MLRELMEFLFEKAENTAFARPMEIADPRRKYFLAGDRSFTVDIPPPARGHVVRNLSDFIEAAVKYGGKGTVWHDDKQVVLVLDDEDRRDRICMPLVLSEKFQLIRGLGQPMDQATFVRLLKNQLAGIVPDTLRPIISRIEVATSAGQRNEINPGRERGSREFAVDVAAGGEIPEWFVANPTVYANVGLRTARPIMLSLDYTLPPAQVTFIVKPLPDEIEIAMQNAQAELHELLVAALGIDVFCGTP